MNRLVIRRWTSEVQVPSSGPHSYRQREFLERLRTFRAILRFPCLPSDMIRILIIVEKIFHIRPSTWPAACFSLAVVLGLSACDTTSPRPTAEDVVDQLEVVLNPSGFAPLTAEVTLKTTQPVQVEILVPGRNSPAGDVRYLFQSVSTAHTFPVLGLYSSHNNAVQLRLMDDTGQDLGSITRMIQTEPVIPGMPAITIDVIRTGHAPGMNMVSYFGITGELFPMTPFMVDNEGALRWYLDYEGHEYLSDLFYDTGPERLANGNLIFGDAHSDIISSIDMLGNVVNQWPVPGYDFRHTVIEMVPNGNLLATVSKKGIATIEDHIIEIDRQTGAIVQEWDLRESLDVARRAWRADARDWFHGNGLAYDAVADAVIISGRVQGTVKLTRNNEVIWILAPHRDWETAGDGTNLATKLLTPLDATGTRISNADVLEGVTAHPDFDWSWYQHAPKLMPNGDLLLFDNGSWRHYEISGSFYSRAVVYRIDDVGMTIQQAWEYGKARGDATFSALMSDADYHPNEDNIAFLPGAIYHHSQGYGRIIEVDVSSRSVVFEATITPPETWWPGATFHRAERMSIYPPGL